MSQKTHSMVVLSELSSLIVNISICIALSLLSLFNDMMHAKWTYHALTQGIRTIKTFIKFKKRYCLSINLSQKNTREQLSLLSNVEFTVTKQKPLNQRYNPQLGILQKFSNFCCKIETFLVFHLYFASNITLLLRFRTSNKFYYYAQSAKVNSKDVSW